MTGGKGRTLDHRAWLIWGCAASLPALVGRNPFTLAAVTIAVIGVRLTWEPAATGLSSWRWLIRFALIFAAVGVLFNLLTYHGGNIEIVRIPARVPLLGGPLTLNALVYGVLSGWALLLLVLIGTTIGALIDWPALLRVLPVRIATFAVAGSVAFTFLPQTANAYREIREAQAIRGHRLSGARDLPPILGPLLTSGLERAITMAEALESRAFGASRPETGGSRERLGIAVLATSAVVAAFLSFDGHGPLAMIVLAGGTAIVALPSHKRGFPARTSYRRSEWRRADAAVLLGAAIVLVTTLGGLATDVGGLRYEPYPSLGVPTISVPLLAVLGLLLAPAFVAPAWVEERVAA